MVFLAEAFLGGVEVFFSGCISKVVNDGTDFSKPKIKSIINDKKNRNFSTKIYRVIEKALKIVTDKKFNDTDELYVAMETIFNEFRDHGDTLESVRCGLGLLCPDVSEYMCQRFLEKFYEGICQDDDLYKEVSMILQEKGLKNSQEEFQKVNKKLDKNHMELAEKIDSINENLNGGSNEKNTVAGKSGIQNNKKSDYIKTWNNRMFLHIDNDENPLTLADAFIMPDYKMIKFIKRIGFSDEDILDVIIDKFMKYDRTSTMLITGVPGIGKSSITSWIADRYKNDDNVIVLRFRDWEYEELNFGLLKAVYNTLACRKKDLENKILVLDGFDEIKALDRRDNLLGDFINKMNDFDNLKCIITSRPAYINEQYFKNVFELKEFNIGRVEKFYKTITGTDLREKEKIENNLEVLGIPVILYMAIMSDVDISENPTKPELYNRIFAETGGIFDKFSYEGIGYSSGEQILRKPDNAKEYLRFLGKVAFRMFEKDSLMLKTGEYEVPKLESENGSVSILEFPIKHLFENTDADIEFIHKSIYEYFVSDYIYRLIANVINEYGETKLAGVLGDLFKSYRLSKEILEFLEYKIRNKLNDKFDVFEKTFQLMLQDGMTYYTGKRYKNVIQCEMTVFANMLEVIHLWFFIVWKPDKLLVEFIRLNRMDQLNLLKTNLYNEKFSLFDVPKVSNLRGVYLKGADLRYANLMGFDLTMSNLSGADLRKAELNSAKLVRANLTNANLVGAKLHEINLMNADLRDAVFDVKQILQLEKGNNLQQTRVYMQNGEVVDYEEFSKKRR